MPPSPYVGIQFAAIPEFHATGTAVGRQIMAALLGKVSADEALSLSQQAAEREMRKGNYQR